MADCSPKPGSSDEKASDNHEDNGENEACEKEEPREPGSDQADKIPESAEKKKIDVLLKPTGNAPIMQKRKWAVSPQMKLKEIVAFIRKYLKMDQSDSLFLYVNQAFAPPLDHDVKNLYECFGTNGKLILHYATTPAWG